MEQITETLEYVSMLIRNRGAAAASLNRNYSEDERLMILMNAKKLFAAGFAMTSFIEIAQIFTGRTTDIDDIITNIAGTLIGYLIAYWFTGVFTRRIVKNSKKNDFYIICATVALIMFFLQPFISSLLWEMIL